MKTERFFEKFEDLTGSPKALARLRDLVLQMAVQGRLSSPDPKDQRPEVSFPRLSSVAVGHTGVRRIPDSWLSVPLDALGEWRGGGTPSSSRADFWTGRIPWISPKDMKVLFVGDAQDHISEAAVQGSSVRLIPSGSLLMVVRGMILARAFPVALSTRDVTVNQDMKALVLDEPEMKDFLLLALRALERRVLAGVTHSTHGTCKLEMSFLTNLQIPIPPLAEQKRIVAKADELLALCDRLEAQQQERGARHAALASASAERFTEAPTPANVEFLFHRSYDMDPRDLRKVVLALAIRGKLEPQRRSDEPVDDLLVRVQRKRRALVEEGRASDGGELPPVGVEEQPFEVPNTWRWIRFGAVSVCRDGQRIPVSKDERAGRRGPYDYYGASGVIDKIDGFLFDEPLLLIGEDGANLLNRSTPIAFLAYGRYWVNNHAHVLDSDSVDVLRYLALVFNAIDLAPFITGTAQPKMNQAKMNTIPIPVPPVEEQRRIVERVDRLMDLVGKLGERLVVSRAAGEKLLEAVVAELTESARAAYG